MSPHSRQDRNRARIDPEKTSRRTLQPWRDRGSFSCLAWDDLSLTGQVLSGQCPSRNWAAGSTVQTQLLVRHYTQCTVPLVENEQEAVAHRCD